MTKQPVPAVEAASTNLKFDTDKGSSVSTWIASSLVMALVGWMGSGYILPPEKETASEKVKKVDPISVATKTSTASEVTQFYRAEGYTVPDRDTPLRTKVSGDVLRVPVKEGLWISKGVTIIALDDTSHKADLLQATEAVTRAQREYDNANQLLKRGVATTDRLVQARAALATARAQMAAVVKAGENLKVEAPFDGRIETLDVSEGEYISAGSEIGQLIDATPLTVTIQVAQQSIDKIALGQKASVKLITGEERQGEVVYISKSASSETRTFQAKIEIDNLNLDISAGISAEVVIPTGKVYSHFLTPSVVSLDKNGILGVKVVGSDNKVEFHPINIVESQIDGIWVTGLPDRAEIITIGQGFVSEGELVRPQSEEKI